MRFPITCKLTIATLVPLSVAIVICWVAGVLILHKKISRQAQEKVRHDLNAAQEAYRHELSRIGTVLRFSAIGRTAHALREKDEAELGPILAALRESEQLDLLLALDARGKVLHRANNPAAFGDGRAADPLVAQALKGEMAAGTTVFSEKDMAREGEDLSRQAAIAALHTPMARPRPAEVERRGMLLAVAAPVKDEAGKVLGVLYGGVLLNNNNSLVDRIQRIVFGGGEGQGSATIFLGDLRITTNVRRNDGTRAIGTRLSREVYQRVIEQGEKWVGRAFVVNDWCFSAYQPILSPGGATIGSLYVGMREQPYTALQFQMSLILTGVLLLGALIGIAVSGYVGKRLAQPIKELESLARRLAAGERSVRSTIDTRDEIGELAEMFNEMSSALDERQERISDLNSTLEQKVSARTAELEEKNRLLAKAREELMRSEKLAAIGELAAGVAHEINNPMAIIRGNTELLQLSIPEADANREEVDTIFHQVNRVERIVSSLLTFARQQPKRLERFSVNALLREIVDHVGYQLPLEGITVRERYAEELGEVEVAGDAGQLRQVFTNLIINAIQAMPEGGVLTLATVHHEDAGIYCVQVSDSGVGISKQLSSQLFNPFFTTKSSGTGLGLSVSYGIVKEHGGQIDVQSVPGEGATFRVLLPV